MATKIRKGKRKKSKKTSKKSVGINLDLLEIIKNLSLQNKTLLNQNAKLTSHLTELETKVSALSDLIAKLQTEIKYPSLTKKILETEPKTTEISKEYLEGLKQTKTKSKEVIDFERELLSKTKEQLELEHSNIQSTETVQQEIPKASVETKYGYQIFLYGLIRNDKEDTYTILDINFIVPSNAKIDALGSELWNILHANYTFVDSDQIPAISYRTIEITKENEDKVVTTGDLSMMIDDYVQKSEWKVDQHGKHNNRE